MDLSIIILNYKTAGLVRQTLKHLTTASFPFTVEIIVMDNNSNDGCIAMVQKDFPNVHTIANSKNIGFGGGNNRAINHANGAYVLIMDPDIAESSNAIIKLFTFIKKHPDVGVVGPRLLNPDGSIQFSCFRFPSAATPLFSRTFLKRFKHFRKKYDHYRMLDFDHATTQTVHWLVGGCMLLPKRVFQLVGGFDERYFMYFEDIDLCRTLWAHEYKVVYYPEAEMVHYHQRLSAEVGLVKSFFNKTLYYHLSSWRRYVLKYLGKSVPPIKKLR